MEFQVQRFAFFRHLRQHGEGRAIHSALAAGVGAEFLTCRGHCVLQFEEAAEASLILQHCVAVEVLGLGWMGWRVMEDGGYSVVTTAPAAACWDVPGSRNAVAPPPGRSP